MLTQRRILLAVLVAVASLGSASAGRASTIDVDATRFVGADLSVHIFMDDADGNISVTLTVNDGVGDLRGFFLNIDDFSLLAGLQVTGDDVTGFEYDDDGVINLGGANNLNGNGSPCPCDIGVSIGSPGAGKNEISTTTFVLDATASLSLEHFAHQVAGVRVLSVGRRLQGSSRKIWTISGRNNGSAKLAATISGAHGAGSRSPPRRSCSPGARDARVRRCGASARTGT